MLKQEERAAIKRNYDPIRQALLTNDPLRLPTLYPELVPQEVAMQANAVTAAEIDRALEGDGELVVESMGKKDALEVLRMLGQTSSLTDEDLMVDD